MSHRYDSDDEPDGVWAYDGELDLDSFADELDSVSKSRVKTALTCPRQFAFTYWNEEREPGNYYTERGTQIHDAFEQFHINLMNHISETGKRPSRLAPLMGDSDNWQQWIKYVGGFFEWEEKRWREADSLNEWVPHSVEGKVDIQEPPVGHLPWNGYYDALVSASSIPGTTDEGYAVVDYKSGSIKDKEEYRQTGIYIDLEFYAWALELSGFNVTVGVGVYPKEKDWIVREMPNEDSRELIEDAIDIMEREPTTENYPIEEQPLCDYCHFQDQCPSTW